MGPSLMKAEIVWRHYKRWRYWINCLFGNWLILLIFIFIIEGKVKISHARNKFFCNRIFFDYCSNLRCSLVLFDQLPNLCYHSCQTRSASFIYHCFVCASCTLLRFCIPFYNSDVLTITFDDVEISVLELLLMQNLIWQ